MKLLSLITLTVFTTSEHTLAAYQRLSSVVFFLIISMILLESNSVGYMYIGSDNNYYAAIYIPNDGIEIYPMQLGPWEFPDPEIPF